MNGERAMTRPPLDLANPVNLRAEMARLGIAPMQLHPWWSSDTERMVDPLDSSEMKADLRSFMARLWDAAVKSEAAS